MVLALYQFRGTTNSEEISYDKFLAMVDKGEIEKVEIKSDKLVITAKKKGYFTGLVNDVNLSSRLYKAGVEYKHTIPDTTSMMVLNMLITILPVVLIVGMFVYMTRKMSKGGGMMGIGKSNAKMYVR